VTLENVLVPAAAVVGGIVVGLLVVAVVEAVARRLARRWPLVAAATGRCHRPVRALLVVALGWAGLLAATRPAPWRSGVSHALAIVVIAIVGWLLVGLVHVLEDATLRRAAQSADSRQVRRVQTQAQILRRIGIAVVVVWTVGAALLTFPQVRVIGASVFASAGLLSVVAGLAAQSSLGNIFAGLQLAFTDAIRIDDIVVVQGQVGRIEEVTLTYVGVRLWDDRRVILPSSWFTTTPFENWTHSGAELLGTVELDVDWSVPVAAMRAEMDRLLAASALWDGRVGVLQVTDATGGHLRVRVLVSAADSGTLFSLRCEVREGLADWVVRESPGALPRTRMERLGPLGPDGGDPAADGDGAPPPVAADEP